MEQEEQSEYDNEDEFATRRAKKRLRRRRRRRRIEEQVQEEKQEEAVEINRGKRNRTTDRRSKPTENEVSSDKARDNITEFVRGLTNASTTDLFRHSFSLLDDILYTMHVVGGSGLHQICPRHANRKPPPQAPSISSS